MAYIKENKFGRITISDKAFALSIASILAEEDLRQRVRLSNKRGRAVADADYITQAEAAQSVSVSAGDDGRAHISFCAVVRFGESISALARECADRIAVSAKQMTGSFPAEVTMDVRGIKSIGTAKRSMEVTIGYEADGSRIDA